MKTIVATAAAPAAIGPYAQAVRHGDLLFVSGTLGMDPKTGEFAGPGIEAQASRALENLKAIVEAAGLSLGNVLKSTVFLRDMNDFAKFNEIYARYFPADPPARETVQVARLPRDAAIEISVICGA
ncbi:MAG: Rid family detoxifying hydrolase [Syntrophobacterales bacterium]|nr:Rid family detoxifying hydrolase [Syntrophobacterales bacterium]HNQ02498.1 Rid family detoxifying hydrolase [Syntrophales bacterium]